MDYVVSKEQMRAAEKAVMDGGVSESVLIDKAAAAVFERGYKFRKTDKVLIAAGGGNNGADGLSLALILNENAIKTEVLLAAIEQNENVKTRLELVKKKNIKIVEGVDTSKNYTVIVDAIFGIGLNRPVTGEIAALINKINSIENAVKISLDIPSGLNADTGKADGTCIMSDITLTFSACKTGLIMGEALNYAGQIKVLDVSIPVCGDMLLCGKEDCAIEKRKRVSHKYDYGKIVIAGGSSTMPGAAAIASKAALKGGAGLVVTALPDCLKNAFTVEVLETMYYFLPSNADRILFDETALSGLMQKTNAIALGMGMPPDDELKKTIAYLSKNFEGALILDAGALSSLSQDLSLIENAKAKIILTPHAGEFERLAANERDKGLPVYQRVRNLARKLNAVILYKSAFSIISNGEKTVFNISGTAALSKGGTGDALSGLTAALTVRSDPFKAAYIASFIIGKAGEDAEKVFGSEGVTASGLIENIRL